MDINSFYISLENNLPKSNAQQRRDWAQAIITEQIDIKALFSLLHAEKAVATRFLWMLSEIGEINKDVLGNELPLLFIKAKQEQSFNFLESFATFWRIAGVPAENESEAIDLLFDWVTGKSINVTTKSRALFALYDLTKKYPELKPELKACLESQLETSSLDFKKRAEKVLQML